MSNSRSSNGSPTNYTAEADRRLTSTGGVKRKPADVPDIDLLDTRPTWDDYYRSRVRDFGGTGLINRKDLLEIHWPGVSVKMCKALYNGDHVTGVRLPVVGLSQKWPLFWIPHVIKVEWELFGKLGGKLVI